MYRAPEEREIYVGLMLAGALPMIPFFACDARAGAGFTIGFLMVAGGLIGVVTSRLH